MKRIVVKVGGHALDRLDAASPVLRSLADDIGSISDTTATVVVHGGGPQIASLLERVGLVSEFVDGLRVTTPETMEYVAMALALVNLRITAAMNSAELAAVGLCGVDGALVRASARGGRLGRVAHEVRVNGGLLTSLLDEHWTPVVGPVASDVAGELLNCNADTVAGSIAAALDADVLVLLSDVDQLRSDRDVPASALASVSSADVRSMMVDGSIRDGMLPKMQAALDALDAGADRVVLANGTRPHALLGVLQGTNPSTEVKR